MKIRGKMVSFFVISLLLLSILSMGPIRFNPVRAQPPNGSLIGVISDEGVKPDALGLYGYLNVTIGINVTESGNFTVGSDYLMDNSDYYFPPSAQTSGYLNVGIENLTLSFYGRAIYQSGHDPYSLGDLYLYANNTLIEEIYAQNASLVLSHIYNYSEFDPVAMLMLPGISYDKVVGTGSYGLFDYLQLGVEVNVTDAETYIVDVEFYSSYTGEFLSNSSTVNLSYGLQIVNVTFNGVMIHLYKMNLSTAYSVSLWEQINESKGMMFFQGLSYLSNVPLPTPYNYTEFNPHAYLTGRVYDHGTDTDNDGPFDYLQTNIEVNVTENGTYQVSVQGLAGTNSTQMYDYQVSSSLSLSEGIHLFNVSFYGPEIAYYGINPRNVTGVSLSELPDSSGFTGQVDYMQSIPLLTPYNSSDFYHPLNDMQLNFTVNPDGSVGINAMLNATHMYPENPYGLVTNASARFSKKNNSILGSVSGTVGLPPYEEQFPTNQTTADYLSQYNNGILTVKLNATSVFPSIKTQYPYNTTDFTLLGTYLNGVMHTQLSGTSILPQNIASQLPFNVTDVTVEAYLGSNNEFKGNITVHIVSGLPIGDLIVNFEGNRSGMQFTGNFSVPYGTYNGVEVDNTTISQLISEIESNVTGEGPSSLYNMTGGTLELTSVEVTNATIPGGIRIYYNASIRGDFAALIARILNEAYFSSTYGDQYYPVIYAALNSTLSSVNDMSFTMSYDYTQSLVSMDISFDSNIKTLWSNALELIPSLKVPQNETDEINALLNLGNATANAVQNAWLNITYSGTALQPLLTLNASVVVENVTQLKNDTIKLIPDLLSYVISTSPQEQNIIESYLNTTYATLDSANTTIHLQNGLAAFTTDFAFGGNLDEQINAAKACYVNLLNYTYSLTNESLPKLLISLNQTSIDINNLSANLQYGIDNAFLNVTGIVVYPPVQAINNSRAFKLTKFFNIASLLGSNEPPTEFEELKIIIQGGSNSTNTVIPSTNGTVPAPNEISLDRQAFTWENTSVSSLKDMIFQIAYLGIYKNYSVPILSNSTVSNFEFNPSSKTISFNVTGTGTTGYCNVTIPRNLLSSPSNPWVIKEDNNTLQQGNIPLKAGQYNITQNAEYTFIYITYTTSSHTIYIIGSTTIVQEMPPDAMLFIMLIASLIAMILITTQRRKIRSLKTQAFNIANRILHHLSNF